MRSMLSTYHMRSTLSTSTPHCTASVPTTVSSYTQGHYSTSHHSHPRDGCHCSYEETVTVLLVFSSSQCSCLLYLQQRHRGARINTITPHYLITHEHHSIQGFLLAVAVFAIPAATPLWNWGHRVNPSPAPVAVKSSAMITPLGRDRPVQQTQ